MKPFILWPELPFSPNYVKIQLLVAVAVLSLVVKAGLIVPDRTDPGLIDVRLYLTLFEYQRVREEMANN